MDAIKPKTPPITPDQSKTDRRIGALEDKVRSLERDLRSLKQSFEEKMRGNFSGGR